MPEIPAPMTIIDIRRRRSGCWPLDETQVLRGELDVLGWHVFTVGSSSSSRRTSPVGAGTAGFAPASQSSTAATAACLISAATSGGNPPESLSSIPLLRVGRYRAPSHFRSPVSW